LTPSVARHNITGVKAEALKGHLDSMILAVLGAEPAHGYAVIESLRRRSGGVFELPEGTVYPALHRLEAERLLTSSWDTSSGRQRRVYRLTRRGRSALPARRSEWQVFARAVDGVLA
jgi:DNA-binding PadR family transcriptional regulator